MKNFFFPSKKICIGVIHFPPLLGVAGAPSLALAEQNALADLRALEAGGVDAVIIENNYDLPHRIHVGSGTIASMTVLGNAIRKATTLPIGVCVLWNDAEASFAVAKAIDAQFVRIPVFVDTVETDFGTISGDPQQIQSIRQSLSAEGIRLIVDIHVKHAKILSGNTIAQAAELAVSSGADGVIVTGSWTGQAPLLDDLAAVRTAVATATILAGSGVDASNASEILAYADGAIVSTSLKEGATASNERNVKTWHQRIDVEKVKELTRMFRGR